MVLRALLAFAKAARWAGVRPMKIPRCCIAILLAAWACLPAWADLVQAELAVGQELPIRDTLKIGEEPDADAKACLSGIAWQPGEFKASCERATAGDFLLRFPSARPIGDADNDAAALEWMPARDAGGKLLTAPAVVVAHESGRGMVVGRLFAIALRSKGFHALLLHLPGFGARTSSVTGDFSRMLPAITQAVADARRARDVAAALPGVAAGDISMLGVSLGGCVTAAAAGLDKGYRKHFIVLAGGNIAHMLLNGQRDAAAIRNGLLAHGYTKDRIARESLAVEPLRLARRVAADSCWLFSGSKDEVVPPRCSREFAAAARLPAGHHLEYPVGHYDAGSRMPAMIGQVANLLRDRPINEGLPKALKLPGGSPGGEE
jgi:dienelactone hydrolase